MSIRLKSLITLIGLIILISHFSSLNSHFVFADYTSALRDYTYNYQLYKTSLNEFQIAKSSYLTYRTLNSQNEVIAKFKNVLKARNQVIAVYYNLLQEKLNSTEGISPDTKSTFAAVRESEQTWLTGHQKRIDDASTIEDLNSVGSEFESRFPQMDSETKQAIGSVLLIKETLFKARLDNIIARLTSKTEEIRASGESTTIMDRGLIAAGNKQDFYFTSYNAAKELFSAQNINIFNGQTKLSEANQYLRETVKILKEIVRSVTGEL